MKVRLVELLGIRINAPTASLTQKAVEAYEGIAFVPLSLRLSYGQAFAIIAQRDLVRANFI